MQALVVDLALGELLALHARSWPGVACGTHGQHEQVCRRQRNWNGSLLSTMQARSLQLLCIALSAFDGVDVLVIMCSRKEFSKWKAWRSQVSLGGSGGSVG